MVALCRHAHLLYCHAGPQGKDRIAGPLSLVQQDSESTQGVQQALDLNLARSLMLSTCSNEAIHKFNSLDAAGWLHAFVSYICHVLYTVYLLCPSVSRTQHLNISSVLSDLPAIHACLL